MIKSTDRFSSAKEKEKKRLKHLSTWYFEVMVNVLAAWRKTSCFSTCWGATALRQWGDFLSRHWPERCFGLHDLRTWPPRLFSVGLSEGWNLRSVNVYDTEYLELLNTKSDCKAQTVLVIKSLAWSRIPPWRTKSNDWIMYGVGTGYGKHITEFLVTDVCI